MEFTFSEEQTMVRELARQILEQEVTPERQKAAESSADWMDDALWAALAEANLLGLAVPEELGGMGFGFAELCVLLEELGRQVVPVPAVATLVLGALPIREFGSELLAKEWLPRIAAGKAVVTAALNDDVGGTRVRAEGDELVLEGRKLAVPNAGRADLLLVPAAGESGEGVYAVPGDAPGLELSPSVTSTGEPLFDVTLSGVRVPASARLGDPDSDVSGWLRERALVAIAAVQLGVSERALEITAGYVREREQFGVPIGSFQAVQHRCADAFIDVEAMRWTLWRAAWRLSQGLPAAREAAVAKFWAADGGSRIANAGLHLHGGIGSDVDYPIHRYFLWSKSLELQLGSATEQLVWLGRDMARWGPQEAA